MHNHLLTFIKKNFKSIVFILIVILLPAIYILVYKTGGIKYVYSHTMYIPILLAGAFLGFPFGAITGLVAGVILGPFMPLVVITGEPQLLTNWMYRLIVFVLVGLISGIVSNHLKRIISKNRKLMSTNLETGIPNINYLINLKDEKKLYTLCTIIFSDINHITNEYGISICNKLLKKVYKDLKLELPDRTIIIQPNTEKFWVMMPEQDLDKAALSITNILKKDTSLCENRVYVEYFVGIHKPHNLEECKNLIPFRETDRLARHAEKNNLPYKTYEKNIVDSKHQLKLLSDFEIALKEDQTFLTYHPIVDVKTLKIIGLEALIRWNHPTQGLIQPNGFIPLIEGTKLVEPLLDWVLEKSLGKVKNFYDKDCNTVVSVNISGKNFRDKDLSKKIFKLLDIFNVKPQNIIVEITETVLMNNPEQSQKILDELKEKNILIAIDDFGTGYSSFNYLSRFTIDFLKIDRSFISKIHEPGIFEIVKSTIDLAHKLSYKVVAEGIETLETFKILKHLNCDMAQGYFFTKPVHQDDIIDYYLENETYSID